MTNPVRNTYDKIASTWENKVWVNSKKFNSQIIFFADLDRNEKILDVGIGTGKLSSVLGLDSVFGLDISREMLKYCQRKNSSYILTQGDGESLPFQDNYFDFVFCRNFLQNFENPYIAFKEMCRVLRNDGKVMAIESAVYNGEEIYPTMTVKIVEPHHNTFPTHEALRTLFEENGLRNIEQKVVGLHKRWLNTFCRSKQATEEQRQELFRIYQEEIPEWYKEKYNIVLHPKETEIESTLTFSFIKGIK